MAVASGELVVGAVGDHDRLEYTVIGNPVNLAAKLEKHTRTENVTALTTAATLLRARQQGFSGQDFGPPQRRDVTGLAEPAQLIVLAP
jgi:adenylate cyclase